MGKGEQLHFRCQQRWQLIERESAIVANRNETQSSTNSFSQQLPGDEVAVMLHFREKNHIPGPYKFSAPRLFHQIDAFSSPASEDDLVSVRCTDVIRHPLSGFL